MSLCAVMICASFVAFLFGCSSKELAIPAMIWLVAMFLWGYITAHNEVAKECEQLGSFYVGNDVFECKKVKEQWQPK